MTLDDIKTGMRVEMRNGNRYLAVRETSGELHFYRNDGYMMGCQYIHGSLCYASEDSDWDIVKVFSAPGVSSNFLNLRLYGELLWERKETKKMTVEEVCEALGYEVEIVK